jgi:hypothetical protein
MMIMAKRHYSRIKKMPREEFYTVMEQNWRPVKLEGNAIPLLFQGIPENLLYSIYASGSSLTGYNYSDEIIPSGELIGGIDIYRNSPDDPVTLNKDWYAIIQINDTDSKFLIRGPIRDSEHWINEIPERLDNAIIVAVPPKE